MVFPDVGYLVLGISCRKPISVNQPSHVPGDGECGSGRASCILMCEWPAPVSEMGHACVNPWKQLGAVSKSRKCMMTGVLCSPALLLRRICEWLALKDGKSSFLKVFGCLCLLFAFHSPALQPLLRLPPPAVCRPTTALSHILNWACACRLTPFLLSLPPALMPVCPWPYFGWSGCHSPHSSLSGLSLRGLLCRLFLTCGTWSLTVICWPAFSSSSRANSGLVFSERTFLYLNLDSVPRTC